MTAAELERCEAELEQRKIELDAMANHCRATRDDLAALNGKLDDISDRIWRRFLDQHPELDD